MDRINTLQSRPSFVWDDTRSLAQNAVELGRMLAATGDLFLRHDGTLLELEVGCPPSLVADKVTLLAAVHDRVDARRLDGKPLVGQEIGALLGLQCFLSCFPTGDMVPPRPVLDCSLVSAPLVIWVVTGFESPADRAYAQGLALMEEKRLVELTN